jgi:hypothetical protein
VIGHDHISSSVLLVATFGGKDPTLTNPLIFPHLSREQLTDALLPIHPTKSDKYRRSITLKEESPGKVSVLDTPYKTN